MCDIENQCTINNTIPMTTVSLVTSAELVKSLPMLSDSTISTSDDNQPFKTLPDASKRKFQCGACYKMFLKPSHVLRHIKSVHPSGVDAQNQPPNAMNTMCQTRPKDITKSGKKRQFACNICQKLFSAPSFVQRHKKIMHQIEPKVTVEKKDKTSVNFPCSMCDKIFSDKSNRRRHMKRVHKIYQHPEPLRKQYLTCSECFSSFATSSLFTDHFPEKHPDIILNLEKLSFQSFEEFENWKLGMEKQTASCYLHKRTTKDSEGNSRYYFNCHRNGYFNSSSKGLKRMKRVGSSKINSFCPARIKAEEMSLPDGSTILQVDFHSTHVGHQCDANHLRITKQDKDEIAKKLRAGLPIQHILNSFKESALATQRLATLKWQDIRNIAMCYGIKWKKTGKNEEDTPVDQIDHWENNSIPIDTGFRHSSDEDGGLEVEENRQLGVETPYVHQLTTESLLEDFQGLQNLKDEARSAVLGFLPHLETYTKEEQFQTIITTINLLRQSCETMQHSAKRFPAVTPYLAVPCEENDQQKPQITKKEKNDKDGMYQSANIIALKSANLLIDASSAIKA